MEPTSSISLAPTPKDLVIQCSGCKTIVGDTANNACAATLGTAKIIALPGKIPSTFFKSFFLSTTVF